MEAILILLQINIYLLYYNISLFNKLEDFINYFINYFNLKMNNDIKKTKINRTNKILNNFLLKHQEIIKNKTNYSLVINELDYKFKSQNEKFKLTPTQKLIAKSLSQKSCVIIYLGLFYDFKKDIWDKLELLKEIIHTSIKIKVPIILLGENNPINFIPKLNQSISAFFSNSNYITPYHYKKRWFDTPLRLSHNKISKSPCKVSMKQMIDDIIDQYQIEGNICMILKIHDINFV